MPQKCDDRPALSLSPRPFLLPLRINRKKSIAHRTAPFRQERDHTGNYSSKRHCKIVFHFIDPQASAPTPHPDARRQCLITHPHHLLSNACLAVRSSRMAVLSFAPPPPGLHTDT